MTRQIHSSIKSRHVTAEPGSPERYEIYTMCECAACEGTGKYGAIHSGGSYVRCPDCRGEGRVKQLMAAVGSPEAIGTALVHMGREGEWGDCPIGILDTEGEKGQKWLVRPWQASTRNVSDAARVLAKSKTKEKT